MEDPVGLFQGSMYYVHMSILKENLRLFKQELVLVFEEKIYLILSL